MFCWVAFYVISVGTPRVRHRRRDVFDWLRNKTVAPARNTLQCLGYHSDSHHSLPAKPDRLELGGKTGERGADERH